MAIEIKVPTVGESINEVTLVKWHKKEGDWVNRDEVIAELESDKATFELTATSDGVLKIVKPQGSTVPIGDLLCEIEPNGAATSSAAKPSASPSASHNAACFW